MEIRTDLVDAHLYAFNRLIVQGVLASRPTIKSIKQDLVPYLVRSQLRLGVPSTTVGSPVEDKEDSHHQPSLPDTEAFAQLLQSSQSVNRVPSSPLKCCTYMANQGKFCVRVNSLQVRLSQFLSRIQQHIKSIISCMHKSTLLSKFTI